MGKNQHGFVQGKLCPNNLLEVFEEVMCAVNAGKPVGVNYLDLLEAFDKGRHQRLLQNIEVDQNGVSGGSQDSALEHHSHIIYINEGSEGIML